MSNNGILIAPVGCSGSGKTRLRDLLKKKLEIFVVSPDDIRRETLGSISDQSGGDKIFRIANSLAHQHLDNNEIVFFDATNLRPLQLLKEFEFVVFPFMEDSKDPELCYSRVRQDLENSRDRSNVPEDIVFNQSKRFMNIDRSNLNAVSIKGYDDCLKLIEYIKDLHEQQLLSGEEV